MAEAALLDSWIDGREDRRDDQARYELISPVDGSVASRIVDSNADLVDAAVENALAAFRAHRATPAATRAGWLVKGGRRDRRGEGCNRRRADPRHRQTGPSGDLRSRTVRRVRPPRRGRDRRAPGRDPAARHLCTGRRPARLHQARSLRRGGCDHAVQRASQPAGAKGPRLRWRWAMPSSSSRRRRASRPR